MAAAGETTAEASLRSSSQSGGRSIVRRSVAVRRGFCGKGITSWLPQRNPFLLHPTPRTYVALTTGSKLRWPAYSSYLLTEAPALRTRRLPFSSGVLPSTVFGRPRSPELSTNRPCHSHSTGRSISFARRQVPGGRHAARPGEYGFDIRSGISAVRTALN